MGSLPSKHASNRASNRVGAGPICTRRGLMSLPNELLLDITHYLTTTRDVYMLLRANTRLALLLPHVLSAMLLHIYDSRAWNSLFTAPTSHAESLVSRLISLNIDIDAAICNCINPVRPYCYCAPPLHYAISHSNSAMVTTLLHHGVSITTRCRSSGENAVHHAILTTDLNSGHLRIERSEDLAILAMLLSGGRLLRMNDAAALSAEGETWLNTAVQTCPGSSVTRVLPFLVLGLDVNVADRNMHTPLHIAVLNGRPDLAKLLLLRGAKWRTVDSRGHSPWSTACNRPNCELIGLLLSCDYELIRTVVNGRGETAEVCLQRKLDRLLHSDESERHIWLRDIEEITEMVGRLRTLASASR